MREILEVVWPLGKLTQRPQQIAPRLNTLEGKTICGLLGWHFRFEETWETLKPLLAKRYPGIKFVGWEQFGSLQPTTETTILEALPGKLKEHGCDAVITGTGC
ncbi:MAG: hypothetical protein HYX90_07910 [Chloroflexi bacterium]|nr:hypothetical protein [Chloroflexota bacterium]